MAMGTATTSLSILIPTYNNVCVELVHALATEGSSIEGLAFEILVADDGSTDADTVAANQAMTSFPHTRYIVRKENVGRSAIRNFLARTAQYEHLLFIDSHMQVISPNFIRNYLPHQDKPIVCGGYTIEPSYRHSTDKLRQAYEVSCLDQQSCAWRSHAPHAHFHTSNFMVQRAIMLRHPLDERFKHYGYEDVLYGKTLKEAGILIHHIDNPLGFHVFETNARFMDKTDEGLRTLYAFRNELQGYSRLLALSERLGKWRLLWVPRIVYRMAGKLLRRHLTGNHPSLWAFKVYRLCYFAHIHGSGWE